MTAVVIPVVAPASGYPIAQIQNMPAVAHNNAADIIIASIGQNPVDSVLFGKTQEKFAWIAPDLTEFLTAFANGGRTNDGQSFLDMIRGERVEKCLVRILKIT